MVRPLSRSGRELAALDTDVPLIAMTYYNIFLHYGLERAAGRLAGRSAFQGAIVPDLSLEESDEWSRPATRTTSRRSFSSRRRRRHSDSPRVAQPAKGSSTPRPAWPSPEQHEEGEGSESWAVRRRVTLPVYVGIGISDTRIRQQRPRPSATGLSWVRRWSRSSSMAGRPQTSRLFVRLSVTRIDDYRAHD